MVDRTDEYKEKVKLLEEERKPKLTTLEKKEVARNERALRKNTSLREVLEINQHTQDMVFQNIMPLSLQIQTLATILIEKGITTEEELEQVSERLLNGVKASSVNPEAKTDTV